MKQVVQEIRSGRTGVRDLPAPTANPGQVLVATQASLISAGTERYVVDLAKKSLLGKARQRPDQVKRVLQKLKQEGVFSTVQQVRAKLDEPMPLGYSSAGIVLECGSGVTEYKPGDRVATAAPHASVVSVGRNLCAAIPNGVSFEQAAYTSVASISLEGVRLGRVTLGERVLVIGLGLIGQIAVCLLKAQGCKVFGTDLDPAKVQLALSLGADAAEVRPSADQLKAFSDGHGVDAVLITAATDSNQPIEFAAEVARVRGRIVLVGVAGTQIPRPPFFQKELEFTVSASLGPGRWDPSYEEKGIDYPIGHARWTVQRNMQAVLETIASGRLPVQRFTTHRFDISKAPDAYDLITEGKQPFLGVLLTYPEAETKPIRRVELKALAHRSKKFGVSMVGAGNFARLILLPILGRLSGFELRGLASARGMNAEYSGRNMGFAFAATDTAEVLKDDATHAVFFATRHDLHGNQVLSALDAGKHAFVEKPLCIKSEELTAIDALIRALGDASPIVTVGFNRRFSPAVDELRKHFRGITTPLSVSFRFAAAHIPANAWPQDEDVGGGRIIGEACHAVDTCTAIVGSPPVRVFAESVAKLGGVETTDDRVFITIRHANGSISNISYQAGGDKAGPKERIEVFGGGRTAVVEDFDDIALWAGGNLTHRKGAKDKGHANELRAFLDAAAKGGAWPIPWDQLYAVSWASIMAVRSLREGRAIDIDEAAE